MKTDSLKPDLSRILLQSVQSFFSGASGKSPIEVGLDRLNQDYLTEAGFVMSPASVGPNLLQDLPRFITRCRICNKSFFSQVLLQ